MGRWFSRLIGRAAGSLFLKMWNRRMERIAIWVEANRNSIEVVKPLEDALSDGENPIQGMVAGSIYNMREAEKALKAANGPVSVSVRAPSIRHATFRFSICFRRVSRRPGHWSGWRRGSV